MQILVTNMLAGEYAVQVFSRINTCLNLRLFPIDMYIFSAGFWIARIIAGTVNETVPRQFMNGWKQNTILLHRRTIIS